LDEEQHVSIFAQHQLLADAFIAFVDCMCMFVKRLSLHHQTTFECQIETFVGTALPNASTAINQQKFELDQLCRQSKFANPIVSLLPT
jgi:hypothetical protein